MFSREQLIHIHQEIQVFKEHLWYAHDEPDMFPVMTVRWRGQTANQAVDLGKIGQVIEKVAKRLPDDHFLNSNTVGDPKWLFKMALVALEDGVRLPGIENYPEPGEPLEAVWCSVEGYSAAAETMEEIHERAGHLDDEFRNNPASGVRERLTTYIIQTGSTGLAEFARITTGFGKEDGGRIVWDEPRIWSSEPELVDEDERLLKWTDAIIESISPYVTREALS